MYSEEAGGRELTFLQRTEGSLRSADLGDVFVCLANRWLSSSVNVLIVLSKMYRTSQFLIATATVTSL